MTVSQITFMSVEFTWEKEFSCPEDVSVNHFVPCYIDVVEVLQMWQVHGFKTQRDRVCTFRGKNTIYSFFSWLKYIMPLRNVSYSRYFTNYSIKVYVDIFILKILKMR